MPNYLCDSDDYLSKRFMSEGYLRVKTRPDPFHYIYKKISDHVLAETGCDDLNRIHEYVDCTQINDFRSKVMSCLNSDPLVHKAYYMFAAEYLHSLVGNELVKQRNLNLSIQLPGDSSSTLPIHADSLQGDSPYEVVVWAPLVDCFGTKGMFFSNHIVNTFGGKSLDDIQRECAAKPVECQFGEFLIFTPNFFHGNSVNETDETRWSLNCRFKSVLSPYDDKKLGEFFEPITVRAATTIGMKYVKPV